jgi:hypothetical protein
MRNENILSDLHVPESEGFQLALTFDEADCEEEDTAEIHRFDRYGYDLLTPRWPIAPIPVSSYDR